MYNSFFQSLTKLTKTEFVIPKVFHFLLRKNTLLRILYWKEKKIVSIVAKRGNLELCFQSIF